MNECTIYMYMRVCWKLIISQQTSYSFAFIEPDKKAPSLAADPAACDPVYARLGRDQSQAREERERPSPDV